MQANIFKTITKKFPQFMHSLCNKIASFMTKYNFLPCLYRRNFNKSRSNLPSGGNQAIKKCFVFILMFRISVLNLNLKKSE